MTGILSTACLVGERHRGRRWCSVLLSPRSNLSVDSQLERSNNHTDPPLTLAEPLALIEAIHARKMKAGVAISPDTPSSAITAQVGSAADMLLVMTVYPGDPSVCIMSIRR
jgi:hypothetical protein